MTANLQSLRNEAGDDGKVSAVQNLIWSRMLGVSQRLRTEDRAMTLTHDNCRLSRVTDDPDAFASSERHIDGQS